MRKAELFADLLMGAALADGHLDGRERQRVRALMCELLGHAELSASLEARLDGFSHDQLDVRAVCDELALETIEERRKLLEVVVAVHESDEVWDYDEDAFVRELASALGVPDSELAGLAAEDVSLHELGEALDVQDVGTLAELVE
jgi:uncharacterized tellurite resistance protein B-like protein